MEVVSSAWKIFADVLYRYIHLQWDECTVQYFALYVHCTTFDTREQFLTSFLALGIAAFGMLILVISGMMFYAILY
jgi:hypothetical protein